MRLWHAQDKEPPLGKKTGEYFDQILRLCSGFAACWRLPVSMLCSYMETELGEQEQERWNKITEYLSEMPKGCLDKEKLLYHLCCSTEVLSFLAA